MAATVGVVVLPLLLPWAILFNLYYCYYLGLLQMLHSDQQLTLQLLMFQLVVVVVMPLSCLSLIQHQLPPTAQMCQAIFSFSFEYGQLFFVSYPASYTYLQINSLFLGLYHLNLMQVTLVPHLLPRPHHTLPIVQITYSYPSNAPSVF